MGRLLEGFWDCEYCDTTHIGGSRRECPNCGKARGENTKFYLDTTKNRHILKEQTDRINCNPDWLCDYCGQLNSDSESVCVSCGAPRTAENLNYFENHAKKEKASSTVSQDLSAVSFEDKNSYISSKEPSSFAKIRKTLLITLLIAISIIGMIFLFQPKEYDITVNELSWERCINVERLQTVQESDWSLPANAHLLYTQQEYSHSQEVFDHYETRTREVAKERISGYETYVSGYRDLGNGYFEEITSERPIYETYYETETYQEPIYRSEPVYLTKYYYEIDKWLFERSVETSSTDKSPFWGEPNLNSDERISTKSETYIVKGINQENGETISFFLSFDDWSALEVGQHVTVKISLGYGEILE